MLSFIQGKLKEAHPQYILVQTGGVGFKIFIPTSFYFNLPELEADVTIYTVMLIKDEEPVLYGFPGAAERDFFKILLGVTGIGPKAGLALLGHLSINRILNALRAEDIGIITTVPGIGAKTARRLVYELKEKLSTIQKKESLNLKEGSAWFLVEEALMGLGYSPLEVARARDQLITEDGSVEELFKKALALFNVG